MGALTQGFETGELWGLNGIIIGKHQFRFEKEPTWVIPAITFEKLFVRALRNYVGVLNIVLKIGPPYTVELGLVGIDDVHITIPGIHGSGEVKGPILQKQISRRYSLDDTNDASVMALLRAFFADVYDLAAFSRADAFTDAIAAAQDLPTR